MDRTSWIGAAVCVLLLVAYPAIINHFYPPVPASKQAGTPAEPAAGTAAESSAPVLRPTPEVVVKEETPQAEQTAELSNAFIRVQFTSLGGGIRDISLLQHLQEQKKGHVILNRGAIVPLLNLNGWTGETEVAAYELDTSSPGKVLFRKRLPSGALLERSYRLSGDYQIELKDLITAASAVDLPSYEICVGTATSPHLKTYERATVAGAWHKTSGAYVTHHLTEFDDTHVLGFHLWGGKTEIVSPENEEIGWTAVKSQFFPLIVRFASEPAIRVRYDRILLPHLGEKNAAVPDAITGEARFKPLSLAQGESTTRVYEVYAGPKEDARLSALPDNQDQAMEFGWLGWIARPLLILMNAVHSHVGNYGWSIVVMTLLIKVVLWMPQTWANNSMKRMSAVAPLMKEIQAKYKDNPEKLNKEMLKVYGDYGVNPLGGCLPMLVQFPIFIGFYTMLQSATELRNAGFLWIHDLSQPDTVATLGLLGFGIPINPMPLLMAASTYASLHMTPQPSGVDNPMQNVIKFMPLIFLVICYNFSSALSLYWTVQSLLSIVQIQVNKLQKAPTLEEMKAQAQEKRRLRQMLKKRRPA